MSTLAEEDSEPPRFSAPMMTALDAAIEHINSHMRFIIFILLMTGVAGVFNAWHLLVASLYSYVPPHWCDIPELMAAGWPPEHIRVVSTLNDTDETICSMIDWNYTLFAELGYDRTLEFIKNSTSYPDEIPCEKFYYNETTPFSTVVSEWDLVCERKVQKSNVQGSIAFGKFLGGFFCGFLADMYGRKPVFLTCCVIYFVSGTSAAFTNTFWIFLIIRFCTGVAGAGCYDCGFTLLAELISKKHRAALGCIYNMGYPIGHITLPGISLVFQTWRNLQLSISLPLIIFAIHFWLLPESPRWLLINGNFERTWKVIRRFDKDYEEHLPADLRKAIHDSRPVAAVEGSAAQDAGPFIAVVSGKVKKAVVSSPRTIQMRTTIEPYEISIMARLTKDVKGVFLLFSTWELCKRISISFFSCNAASMAYYVIALSASNFQQDTRLYMFVSGLVGIPGYMFPLLIMMCMGRKCTTSLLFLSSALSLVFIATIPIEEDSEEILFLAMLGRFTNVAVFGLLTVYVAELFPTVVRNSAIGVALAMSQLGSIYAPYLVDYLGTYDWHLPSTISGIYLLSAAILILLLPETKGKAFLNTLDDVKKIPDKVSFRNCCKWS